jgi:F0F1-type ATP synthase membrane subunit b/b'
METVQAIFTQLGVDSSFLPQFFIVFIVFVITHFLFLDKLQEVLESREDKTVKLENSADETIENVSRMKIEYKLKVDEAQREAYKSSAESKQKITVEYTNQYKQAEREVNQFVDQSRNEFEKEIEENKQKYLAEANTLAASLVKKILQ